MNKNSFSMIDKNGNEVIYDVLFTFESDETGKNYIVYTDNSRDENGSIQVFASIYDPEDPEGHLEAVTTDEEWNMIEEVLERAREEAQRAKKDLDE